MLDQMQHSGEKQERERHREGGGGWGAEGKVGRKHVVSYEGVLLKHPNRIHDYRLGNIGRRGQS